MDVWWAAFQKRLLETAPAFPPSLEGTLAIEIHAPDGRFAFRSVRVRGREVELSDSLLPDDTACLSIAQHDLPLLLEPSAGEAPQVDLWGDGAFARALLEQMSSAPKSRSLLALRAGQ